MKTLFTLFLSATFALISLSSCDDANYNDKIIELNVFSNKDIIITDISFITKQIGYISGSFDSEKGTAVIAKTDDGGLNWETIPVYIKAQPTSLIRSIHGLSNGLLYATYSLADGITEGVCLSKDGGYTWNNSNEFSSLGNISDIYFKNSQEGLVFSNGNILKTTDGGVSSKKVFSYEIYGAVRSLILTSENIGYAYGGSYSEGVGGIGTLVKTIDGGNSWTKLTAINKFITSLTFENDNVGYAFTFDSEIYKTTDGGNTWNLFKNIGSQSKSSYYSTFSLGNNMYLGAGNTIYKTTDHFKTLNSMHTSINNNYSILKVVKPSTNRIIFITDHSIIRIDNR